MSREDIIRLAREAGFTADLAENWLDEVLVWEAEPKNLERFADLVAAAEREACAKVCERYWSAASLESDRTATAIAADIRSRGEVKP